MTRLYDEDLKIGPSITATIGAVADILDCSALVPVGSGQFPFLIEIIARDEPCYIRQGESTIALDAPDSDNTIIPKDSWRIVRIDGYNDAYFAFKRAGTGTGTIVATRISKAV